jgi:hypothetical protein
VLAEQLAPDAGDARNVADVEEEQVELHDLD